ncbi:MAG: hypothetical protein ACMV0I_09355 [Pseudomonas sp.]
MKAKIKMIFSEHFATVAAIIETARVIPYDYVAANLESVLTQALAVIS